MESGLRPDDLLAATHPDDRDILTDLYSNPPDAETQIAIDIRVGEGAAVRTVAVQARTELDDVNGKVPKGTFQDVTEWRATEARLQYLAHHDSLTDLTNRSLLNERLEQALARAKRDGTELAFFLHRCRSLQGYQRHLRA